MQALGGLGEQGLQGRGELAVDWQDKAARTEKETLASKSQKKKTRAKEEG